MEKKSGINRHIIGMSTTKKIAHNTAIQMTGKAVSTLLGLFAIGMMTRYLGTEQFGWYVTAISFLQFIGIVIDFGLVPVTAQMMAEPRFDKTKLLQNLLGFRFLSALIFLGLAPLLVMFFPYPIEVKQAVGIMTVSFLAIAMNQVFTGFYQFKLRMDIQAIGEVIGRLVLVGGLWLLITQQASFLPVMIVVTLASIAYTLYMWLGAMRIAKPTLRFDWDVWKAIFTKSWPIAISIMFNVVYLKGDILLLSLFRDQGDVGIYGAAYRVIDILTQTAMLLMGLMLPLLTYAWARNKKLLFKKRYQQSFDAMMMLGIPMVVGTIVLAEPIMIFVAGQEFAAAGTSLQILALAVGAVYLGSIFGHLAVAINKQKQTMWIYISSAVLTLIGYLYFIPRFGMTGAAWMSVFSEVYVGILLALVVKSFIQEQIVLKTLGKIIAASVIMGLAVSHIAHFPILFTVLVGIVLYSTILYITGAISKATLKEIFAK